MRIDPKLTTAEWPKVSGRAAAKEAEGETKPAVTVSAVPAANASEGVEDVAAASAARRARVAELRSLVESGAYSPDLDELARRLVRVIGRIT